MTDVAKAKARRPAGFALRTRVIAAINDFIAGKDRQDWIAAFASDQFHLLIDQDYQVSIEKRAASTTALFRLAIPLDRLELDPWAIDLGGSVRDTALDEVAQTVVRAVERPEWWVP